MLTLLENGDIIITMAADGAVHAVVYRCEIKSGLSQDKISRTHQVYHSAVSAKSQAVQSNTIKLAWAGALVFRFKDPALRENLTEVAMRWVPAKKDEEKSSARAQQSTPFNEASMRPNDDESLYLKGTERNYVAFFRALRAHERNLSLQPLSKQRGVSCSQFVGFSLKAAILKALYPEGFSDEIKEVISKIQKDKQQFSRQQHEEYKERLEDFKTDLEALSDMQDNKNTWYYDHLPEFAFMNKAIHSDLLKRLSQKEAKLIIKFLCEPVKGMDVKHLYDKLIKYKDLFDQPGRLCFTEENEEMKPYMMPKTAITELLKLKEEKQLPEENNSRWWTFPSELSTQLLPKEKPKPK